MRAWRWEEVTGPSGSGRTPGIRLINIASFPLGVRELKQSHVVLKANSVKHIHVQVAHHGLPQVLGSHIEPSQFRRLHGSVIVHILPVVIASDSSIFLVRFG